MNCAQCGKPESEHTTGGCPKPIQYVGAMTNDARAPSEPTKCPECGALDSIECRECATRFALPTPAGTIAATPDPRVDEIAARLKAATPGPWFESTSSDYFADGAVVVREERDEKAPFPAKCGRVVAVLTRIDGQQTDNADFIAHAPEDIAYLLRVACGAAGAAPPRYEMDLAHLATLGPNWDSYGGVPITPAALAAVRLFMERVQICPRSNGGLQIELAAQSGDAVEDLAFEPDGSIEREDEGAAPPREPSEAAIKAADEAFLASPLGETPGRRLIGSVLRVAYAIDSGVSGSAERETKP